MTTQGSAGPPQPQRRRTFLEKQLAAFAKATAARRSFTRRREDPVRFRHVKRWFYASLAALAASEFVLPRIVGADQAHFWFEDIPAWGSVFGFVACVAIILVSKLLGKLWLTRPENYYDS